MLYARASQTIVDALEVDFAGVLEMLSDGRMLTRAGYRIPDGLEGEIASVIDEGSQPHYVLGAEEEVVVVDDLQAETRFNPVPTLLELGIRSGLTAAIPGRTRPVGSLGAWTRERREFDSTEVELFGLMAAGIGLAVERRRTERRLETHRSLGEVLAMSDTLVEAAPRIVEAICEALDWDAGIVWLADRRREVLRAATVWVDANDPGAERFREEIERMTFAHGERLPGRVWAVGEPQWISYIPPEEERLKRRTLHDAGLRSVLAFPIRRGATVLGVVEILAREMIQPDEDLLEDCERIGRQIGEFIARDQAQRELVQSRDELRTVLRSMPVGVTVVGPDGRYRFVNEVAARINDSTPEELVGVSALDAISGVTITEEDGTELPREELPLFKALRGEPSPPRLVRFHGPAVREQRWAIAHAIPLRESEDSPPTAVVSVVENVTELKEIQEALRMSEARHREISDALQRGLLPPEASEVAGLDFAARLHTEEAGTRIGGDFYDVFPLSGGRYAIVIGDVSGKGVEAAGLTALARYTIRTAAMHDPRPVGVLRCLNEAMLSSGGREHFLTAIYSIVEPKAGGHQVTIASGGHPKPLLVRAGGDVIPIEAQGSLLGWFEHLDLAEGGAELRPGDALILFTDGITEAGYRDRSPGTPVTDDALRELLATCAGEPAERIADAVEQRVLTAEGGELRDDATMVVVSSRAR